MMIVGGNEENKTKHSSKTQCQKQLMQDDIEKHTINEERW